jgi:excisionase family DNA binding protein
MSTCGKSNPGDYPTRCPNPPRPNQKQAASDPANLESTGTSSEICPECDCPLRHESGCVLCVAYGYGECGKCEMNRDQQQSGECVRSEKIDSFPEVMTLEEASSYLRLSSLGSNNVRASIRRLVYERGLPAVRLGRGLVFPKAAIDAWLMDEAKNHSVERNGAGAHRDGSYTGRRRFAGSLERRAR